MAPITLLKQVNASVVLPPERSLERRHYARQNRILELGMAHGVRGRVPKTDLLRGKRGTGVEDLAGI